VAGAANLDATRALLEACRTLKTGPTFVFASSLAVFGKAPGQSLPEVIEDNTLPTPQSSYGVQKFIGEQLVADYARKGFVRGRNVRLMTVSVRPGKPNGAASSFLSGMIREPLAGQRAVCPVPADVAVALSSPGRTIDGLIRAAQTTDADWGPLTAMNLPALRTSVREMAEALGLCGRSLGTDHHEDQHFDGAELAPGRGHRHLCQGSRKAHRRPLQDPDLLQRRAGRRARIDRGGAAGHAGAGLQLHRPGAQLCARDQDPRRALPVPRQGPCPRRARRPHRPGNADQVRRQGLQGAGLGRERLSAT
jgi:nucleoside-diphosphate-sugar epimerase